MVDLRFARFATTIRKCSLMKMIFWDVWLWGELIDSVLYTADCSADYVYHSLVGHDGYDYHIEVRKAK